MREYFLHLLQTLDKLAGIQQYHKLMQLPGWKKELNTLLDILCRVCDQFPYIPDEAKKRIIDTNVVTDGEFIGLNAKCIYKYLQANKDRYFKELAHVETKPEDKPLEGEAFKKKTDWVIAELQKATEPMSARINPYKDIVVPTPVQKGLKYHPADPSVSRLQDLRIQYGREHTNKYTGKTLKDHPTFEQWLKTQSDEPEA